MSAEIESELKFRTEELGSLRERLEELEAERLAPSAPEDNWVLDRGDAIRRTASLLRLRSDRRGATLTFKGPPSFEGQLKQREELECALEDADAMLAILERLGFEVVRRYQKRREEWQLGGVTVALDHTPIGNFVEFEGEGAERVASRCGFDDERTERRSYLRLYEDFLAENPEAPRDMLFESGE